MAPLAFTAGERWLNIAFALSGGTYLGWVQGMVLFITEEARQNLNCMARIYHYWSESTSGGRAAQQEAEPHTENSSSSRSLQMGPSDLLMVHSNILSLLERNALLRKRIVKYAQPFPSWLFRMLSNVGDSSFSNLSQDHLRFSFLRLYEIVPVRRTRLERPVELSL
jgi:hypothetical protein